MRRMSFRAVLQAYIQRQLQTVLGQFTIVSDTVNDDDNDSLCCLAMKPSNQCRPFNFGSHFGSHFYRRFGPFLRLKRFQQTKNRETCNIDGLKAIKQPDFEKPSALKKDEEFHLRKKFNQPRQAYIPKTTLQQRD
jgi:hypothetical protein